MICKHAAASSAADRPSAHQHAALELLAVRGWTPATLSGFGGLVRERAQACAGLGCERAARSAAESARTLSMAKSHVPRIRRLDVSGLWDPGAAVALCAPRPHLGPTA